MFPESPGDAQSKRGPVLTPCDQGLSLNIKNCWFGFKNNPQSDLDGVWKDPGSCFCQRVDAAGSV